MGDKGCDNDRMTARLPLVPQLTRDVGPICDKHHELRLLTLRYTDHSIATKVMKSPTPDDVAGKKWSEKGG